MKQRWYDFDPVISLSVNLIEGASVDVKNHCLKYIIKQAKDYGIKIENDLDDKFEMFWQRRSDSSNLFFEAMEYYKKMETGLQKDIALSIIEYIRKK